MLPIAIKMTEGGFKCLSSPNTTLASNLSVSRGAIHNKYVLDNTLCGAGLAYTTPIPKKLGHYLKHKYKLNTIICKQTVYEQHVQQSVPEPM